MYICYNWRAEIDHYSLFLGFCSPSFVAQQTVPYVCYVVHSELNYFYMILETAVFIELFSQTEYY